MQDRRMDMERLSFLADRISTVLNPTGFFFFLTLLIPE